MALVSREVQGPPSSHRRIRTSHSLLSLPVELLNIILQLLGKHEHLALCLVSFKLLELASKHIYGRLLCLKPDEAHDFVESRVFHPSFKSERITSLLLPIELRFSGLPVPNAFEDLVDVASFLSSPSTLIRTSMLVLDLETLDDLEYWTDALRFLDPDQFALWTGEDDDVKRAPTISFVPLDFVASFTTDWTRLRSFTALGPESVLLVEGTKCTSVFEACLRRCSPDLPRVMIKLESWLWTSKDAVRSKIVEVTDLSTFIDTLDRFDGGFDTVSLRFNMTEATKTSSLSL